MWVWPRVADATASTLARRSRHPADKSRGYPQERHSPWARQRMPWASNPAQAAHSHGAVRRTRSAVAAWQPRLRAAGAGDLPGARAQLERALQIGEADLGPDHPNTLDSMVALSDNLTAMHEHGAAHDLDRSESQFPD